MVIREDEGMDDLPSDESEAEETDESDDDDEGGDEGGRERDSEPTKENMKFLLDILQKKGRYISKLVTTLSSLHMSTGKT